MKGIKFDKHRNVVQLKLSAQVFPGRNLRILNCYHILWWWSFWQRQFGLPSIVNCQFSVMSMVFNFNFTSINGSGCYWSVSMLMDSRMCLQWRCCAGLLPLVVHVGLSCLMFHVPFVWLDLSLFPLQVMCHDNNKSLGTVLFEFLLSMLFGCSCVAAQV